MRTDLIIIIFIQPEFDIVSYLPALLLGRKVTDYNLIIPYRKFSSLSQRNKLIIRIAE